MDDDDGYFGERVAATYDDSSEGMFDPAFVDTVADVLAGLAGAGRDAAARPVGGVDTAAVHQRERPARLGVGEA